LEEKHNNGDSEKDIRKEQDNSTLPPKQTNNLEVQTDTNDVNTLKDTLSKTIQQRKEENSLESMYFFDPLHVQQYVKEMVEFPSDTLHDETIFQFDEGLTLRQQPNNTNHQVPTEHNPQVILPTNDTSEKHELKQEKNIGTNTVTTSGDLQDIYTKRATKIDAALAVFMKAYLKCIVPETQKIRSDTLWDWLWTI